MSPVPGWLQVLAAAGDAVGGIATALALWFAVRTYNTWAAQRRGEKRSELAEQALLAIRSACLLVHTWCLMLAIETTQERGDDAAAREAIRSAVAFGRDDVDAFRSNVQGVQWRASIHLNRDEQQLLMDTEGLLVQAALDADAWVKKIDTTDVDQARAIFVGLSRRASALRERADAMLGPVARFDEPSARTRGPA